MTELEPIEIPVVLSGISEVKSALKSLRDELVKLEKASSKATEESTKKRMKSYQDEINQLKKLHTEADRKVSSDLGSTFGSGGGGGGSRRSPRGTSINGNGGGGFMDLTGLDKQFSNVKKFATGIGLAAAGFLALKAGVEVASEALTQFGSFVLSDVVKPAMELEKRSVQIANSSQGQISAKEIQDTVRASVLKHNIDANQTLEGVGQFQDLTGKAKLGFEMIDTISTIAKGRGFDAKELYGLAGSVTSEGDTAKDVQDKLLKMLAQGDVGSIPLKAIAKLGGKLSATGASFVGDDKSRLAMSAALLQTAKPKVGSEDEAMTALQTFTRESLKAGKKLGKGMVTKDASGVEQLTDPSKLLEKIFLKTAGNKSKLERLGYTDTSSTFIGAYKDTYSKKYAEERTAGKTDKEAKENAAKAVGDFVRSMANANTSLEVESAKEVGVRQTSAEKWDASVNLIKDKLLELMPAVGNFINDFAEIAPQLAENALIISNGFLKLIGAITALWDALPGKLKQGDMAEYSVEGNETNANTALKSFYGITPLHYLNIGAGKLAGKEGGLVNEEESSKKFYGYLPNAGGTTTEFSENFESSKTESYTSEGKLTTAQAGLSAAAERITKVFNKIADSAEDAARTKPLSDR